MYKHILVAVFIGSCTFFSMKTDAQLREDSSEVNESIILKKQGTFPNDLTLHIHGDKVTINGKEPDDIDVIRKKSSTDRRERFKSYRRSFKEDSSRFTPHSFKFKLKGGRPLLGVLTKPSDNGDGARIANVEKGTAADSVGLEKGDVIIKIDQQEITSAQDLSRTINHYKPGSKIVVTYLRDGQQKEAHLTLGRIGGHGGYVGSGSGNFNQPFGEGFPPNQGDIMEWFKRHHPQFQNENPNFRMYARSKGKLGVVVENHDQPEGAEVIHVSPNSVASKAGMEENDVITKFGKETISSIQDLKEAINQSQGKKDVEVVIQRAGKKKMLHVSFEKEHKRAQL